MGVERKSPYAENEWQEGYGIYEAGYAAAVEAALEEYRAELASFARFANCLKKGAGKVINVDNSVESFRKRISLSK